MDRNTMETLLGETINQFKRIMDIVELYGQSYLDNAAVFKLYGKAPLYTGIFQSVNNRTPDENPIYKRLDDISLSQLLLICKDLSRLYNLPVYNKLKSFGITLPGRDFIDDVNAAIERIKQGSPASQSVPLKELINTGALAKLIKSNPDKLYGTANDKLFGRFSDAKTRSFVLSKSEAELQQILDGMTVIMGVDKVEAVI
jgi:hypothetical protein